MQAVTHTKHAGLLQTSKPLHGFDGLGQGFLGLKLPSNRVSWWEVAKFTQPILLRKEKQGLLMGIFFIPSEPDHLFQALKLKGI